MAERYVKVSNGSKIPERATYSEASHLFPDVLVGLGTNCTVGIRDTDTRKAAISGPSLAWRNPFYTASPVEQKCQPSVILMHHLNPQHRPSKPLLQTRPRANRSRVNGLLLRPSCRATLPVRVRAQHYLIQIWSRKRRPSHKAHRWINR